MTEDFDAFDVVDKDDAGKALVAADDVAAATKNIIWKAFFGDECESFCYIGRFFKMNNITGVATQTHGGECRNWDVFLNIHLTILPYLG